MSEDSPITSAPGALASESSGTEAPQSPGGTGTSETAKDSDPMLDVHPPHHAVSNWRDFFIHIATIVIGLLIAIGLEQTVELLHHRHQRHELQEDLRLEAEQNLEVIDRDLKMQELEPWFEKASKTASVAGKGTVEFTLSPAPCLPGSVGTAEYRYFAPSQAVWTTAKEGGLVALLPVDQARMHARLAHNYDLLGAARDQVFSGCQAIVAMRRRFAKVAPTAGSSDSWTMSADQAERLAATAADTQVAIKGLLFRLRWSKVYEQGILNGENAADIKMMTINQERFEDATVHADDKQNR